MDKILKNNIKPKFVDLNVEALAKGMALVS